VLTHVTCIEKTMGSNNRVNRWITAEHALEHAHRAQEACRQKNIDIIERAESLAVLVEILDPASALHSARMVYAEWQDAWKEAQRVMAEVDDECAYLQEEAKSAYEALTEDDLANL